MFSTSETWGMFSSFYFLTCTKIALTWQSRGSSGSDKQKKSGASAKAKAKAKAASAASFDYFDPPDKIEWVLTDETYDRWTAFMGTKELTDSVTHSWVLAFASSTANGFTST